MNRRHYTTADLGPLCAAGCGTRIVSALAASGITEHPACDHAAIMRDKAAASWDRRPSK